MKAYFRHKEMKALSDIDVTAENIGLELAGNQSRCQEKVHGIHGFRDAIRYLRLSYRQRTSDGRALRPCMSYRKKRILPVLLSEAQLRAGWADTETTVPEPLSRPASPESATPGRNRTCSSRTAIPNALESQRRPTHRNPRLTKWLQLKAL